MKSNRLIYVLILIIIVWLTVVSGNVFNKKTDNSENIVNEYEVTGFSTDLTKIVEEAESSIVTINTESSILSGFVYRQINDDVYIVSAYHGLSNASNIAVTFASTYTTSGELIGYDIYLDLAIIKVNTPYQIKELKAADANILKKGEFIISIGTPVSIDYASSVELGMISLKNLFVENSILVDEERHNYYLNLIELSSNLQSGYSGSPVINMNGEFVGMNTMNLSGSFNFAITSNEIRIVADKIIDGDPVYRNNLGFKGVFISDMLNYEKSNLNISIDTIQGIYVSRVKEGSLAYSAGIRNNDIITMINNKEIKDFNDYLQALYYDEGNEIVFEYLHGKERMISGVSRD